MATAPSLLKSAVKCKPSFYSTEGLSGVNFAALAIVSTGYDDSRQIYSTSFINPSINPLSFPMTVSLQCNVLILIFIGIILWLTSTFRFREIVANQACPQSAMAFPPEGKCNTNCSWMSSDSSSTQHLLEAHEPPKDALPQDTTAVP